MTRIASLPSSNDHGSGQCPWSKRLRIGLSSNYKILQAWQIQLPGFFLIKMQPAYGSTYPPGADINRVPAHSFPPCSGCGSIGLRSFVFILPKTNIDPDVLAPWKSVFLYQPVVFRVHGIVFQGVTVLLIWWGTGEAGDQTDVEVDLGHTGGGSFGLVWHVACTRNHQKVSWI